MNPVKTLMTSFGHDAIEVAVGGSPLLDRPLLNKGTAFTCDERLELGLLGLLPPHEETLDEQAARAFEAYQAKTTDLERHIYLRQLQDANETLFYRLLLDHLPLMLPVVYTPTVGLACQQFSHIYRRHRGLFISYPEREHIDTILDNVGPLPVEVIVVTDGERILGLGDQGAGGMGIPIGKLSLYTGCGGIHPAATLPILLDAGTNNPERLADPLYIGWRHERVTGKQYDEFVERFVEAVKRKFPNVLLQWEDFAQTHAGPLLERYRDQLCTFNDDIQGTAAVATATLLAAVAAAGGKLRDQTVAVLGAGSAGCGIAEQLVAAMVEEGLSEPAARARFFMIDRPGLLHDKIPSLLPFQRPLVQPAARVADWAPAPSQPIGLADVVKHAKPTVLLGLSGQPGTFTEPIVRQMAGYAKRPIIFPLSNPTSRSEATPVDLLTWTAGQALVATGSPFGDVTVGGRQYPIAQCNNSYIFPGMGLGVRGVEAKRVTNKMFMAAARALAAYTAKHNGASGALLPPLAESRQVSREIALAVAACAQSEGHAPTCSADELAKKIDAKTWQPRYLPIRLRK